MEFTAHELEVRRPLWVALSDLYLDALPDWTWATRACAESPFTLPKLQRILFDEVHPVLRFNLRDMAGEWQCFDPDWLVASILARKHPPIVRLSWLERRLYPWRQLKPLVAAARQGTVQAP